MRYIKLYEEFRHDEIHDVMMSICDTVSFKESELYPSTERLRIYETSETVEFDPKHYEEYLEGWRILNIEDNIVFIKGNLEEVGLSWLNEIYGNLKPVEIEDKIFYVDGERKPSPVTDTLTTDGLFMYYKELQESKNGYCYISYDRIWSLFKSYFDMEYQEIKDLISVWLGETYNLRGLTPQRLKWMPQISWERPII